MKDVRIIWTLTTAFTKRYFRDKVALFFTFVFPLVFLVVFGFIFSGNNGPNFKVALIDKSKTEFATTFIKQTKDSQVFKFTEATDFDKAKDQLGRGEFDAILELPPSFGELDTKRRPAGTLLTYYNKNNEQLSLTLSAILQGSLDEINMKYTPVESPLKLESKPVQTNNLSRFDYTLAGIIGFSILSLAIFSMSEGFTGDKKAGSLRRMQVAPIHTWQLIIGMALNRILVGIISVALLFTAAMLIFHFDMRGDYLSFIVFTIMSITCMFGFGMAIGGWASNSNQAAPLAQIVSFPMIFLSGVFFPTFLMPQWLQTVTSFIPLTAVVDGLRLILTEGRTIFDLGQQLGVLAVWTLVIYIIAFRVFRWE